MGSALLLITGGPIPTSSFKQSYRILPPQYRYNIPELAKSYKVYAIDLLGFGWSEKAIIDYDAMTWKNQVVDFLKEKVKEPAILVGNR